MRVDGRLLLAGLATPARLRDLSGTAWAAVLGLARRERVLGILAQRVIGGGHIVPHPVRLALEDALTVVAHRHREADWQARRVARDLAGLEAPVLLLKGTAYLLGGLDAAQGRDPGDLDILTPRAALDAVEQRLLAAGWRFAKTDAYDQHYYRAWMHELPPMSHAVRGGELDVHHTWLPPVSGARIDIEAVVADSREGLYGYRLPCLEDLILHSAAHLFADGAMEALVRGLWDLDRLLRALPSDDAASRARLERRAERHRLQRPLARALRACAKYLGTPCLAPVAGDPLAALVEARLTSAGQRGLNARATQTALLARAHLIKMPVPLLVRHSIIKGWRTLRHPETQSLVG